MFGFLKKKLKESVEKITGLAKQAGVEEVEQIEKEAVTEETKQEQIAETALLAPAPAEIKTEPQKEFEPQEPHAATMLLETPAVAPKEKKGLLQRVKKAVKEKKISEEDLKNVLWSTQLSLIESDVAMEVAEKICGDLKNSLVGRSVKRNEVEKVTKESLKKSLKEIFTTETIDLQKRIKAKKPFLILFLGFNGSGKTTTLAKAAYKLKEQGFSCVLAAGDTFRAAAIQQLEEHGARLGINVIKQKYGSDSAAVIFDAVKHASAKGVDVVLADTAGRSHANVNLMDELGKINRVNKPDMKVLVVDALTGNDVVEQARMFDEVVGIDALVLTKVDVYDKGGALLSAAFSIKKPILFLGIGQEYKDLEEFDAEKTIKNLLG